MVTAASKKRITLEALKARIAKGPLRPEEVRRYFKVDKERSEAFLPVVKLDERAVDVGDAYPSTDEVSKLLEDATRPARGKAGAPEAAARPSAARAERILAEGDSWFNLPAGLWPPTCIDVLSRTHDVRSIAHWSHTLEGMLAARQYEQPLRSGNFARFLFSGGGNDVLGSLGTYLKRHQDGDTNPANAPNYVKSTFSGKLDEIIAGFRRLAADVRAMGPAGTVLFVHGYANAIPRRNGPYLGRRLAAQGFDPDTTRELSRAIVAHLISRFNEALRHFASTTANVVYVDMRSAMTVSDWNTDEIHPKETGSLKIAARFAQALAENAPVA